VRVPFAAPPTERNVKRMWITIGVSGAVLLLCCAGGVVGFGVLGVATGQATTTEARNTVRDFLDGLARRDYRKAYDQVCGTVRGRETLAQFTARERGLSPVEGFTVSQPTADGTRLRVPAVVRTPVATSTEVYTVITDRQAGALRVCGGPR
jgi:hypothetical protein